MILIAQDYLQIDILELIGFPFILLYDLIIVLVIIVMLIGAIAYIKKRRGTRKGILPLIITLFLVMTLLFVPISAFRLNIEFNKNREAYQNVVERIESGDIPVFQDENVVELPNEYKYLSRGGGEVIVNKTENSLSVLFFVTRGVTDNYNGFVYISDNSKTTLLSLYDIREYDKKEDYWFWVSCT
jgi:hypothetical protein